VAANAGFPHTSINPTLEELCKMKSLSTIVAGSAASVLVLNGFAFAQQQSPQSQQAQTQQLTNRDVRQFVSQVERDINQMVQSGNLSRLRQWTQAHVADNAVMSRTNSFETEGHSRAIASMTITKPDLLRLQRFVLSSMPEKLRSVEDYRLEIQVVNVQPVGDSAALVKSRVSERATLVPRQADTSGRMGQERTGQEQEFTTGQGQGARAGEDFEDEQPFERRGQRNRQSSRNQGGGVQVESHATCTHLLERNPDAGRIQIAMGICDAQTEAEF
jgi:hypothetical protein